VRVWDLTTGREHTALTGHTYSVTAVACTSIEGRAVAVTGSDDATVRVWDLTTGREHAVLTGHIRTVDAVACTSIDGWPVVITAGYDQTTRIWDLTTMTLTAMIDCPTPEPRVAASPGADILLGLGNDIAVLTRQP
jgi:WD40 repeat protein